MPASPWLGKYLRDVAVTGNVVRKADIGIGVSVASGAGGGVIANNIIAARSGAILGMDGARSSAKISPRRTRAATAQLSIGGNNVR